MGKALDTGRTRVVIRQYESTVAWSFGLWDELSHAWVATPEHDDVSQEVILLATGTQPERHAMVVAAGNDQYTDQRLLLVQPVTGDMEVWHRSNIAAWLPSAGGARPARGGTCAAVSRRDR
jgi:hypothetical protein